MSIESMYEQAKTGVTTITTILAPLYIYGGEILTGLAADAIITQASTTSEDTRDWIRFVIYVGFAGLIMVRMHLKNKREALDIDAYIRDAETKLDKVLNVIQLVQCMANEEIEFANEHNPERKDQIKKIESRVNNIIQEIRIDILKSKKQLNKNVIQKILGL
jgi:hypothetical protein